MKADVEQIQALRRQGRTITEIVAELDVPKSTAHYWTKDIRLPDLHERRSKSATEANKKRGTWRNKAIESKFSKSIDRTKLTRADKGRIAEAAVLFRLALHGLDVAQPVFGGSKSDWLVRNASGTLMKIEVRYARLNKRHGRPYISLRCSDGRNKTRRYRSDEFDYIIGYDLYTDTAFIYSSKELEDNATAVAMDDEHAEKWELLK